MNKTIQFNSEFLSTVSKRKPVDGTRKKGKPSLTDKNTSKELRKKLLDRIREYQNKTTDQRNDAPNNCGNETKCQNIDNTFNNSLEILKNLSSTIAHNKTVKHRPTPNDISLEMPDSFKDGLSNTSTMTHLATTGAPLEATAGEPLKLTIEEIHKDGNNIKEQQRQPLYSSIKNGSRPTYKQMTSQTEVKNDYSQPHHNNSFLNNSSQINQAQINQALRNPNINTESLTSEPESIEPLVSEAVNTNTNLIVSSAPVISEPSLSQPSVNNVITTPNIINTVNIKRSSQPPHIRRKIITKTYKYVVGKNGRNVSVLLKDLKTRKMVKRECSQLANTSIQDIKNYLRKKNLLKIGSNASDEVIKKIYEQAILTGDVRNMSKDTLIHNFMKR